MSTLGVFVFLLENLPGFEHILNLTLHNISNDSFINASVSQCDPILGERIWQDINKKNFKSDNELNYENNYVDSLVPNVISANISTDKIERDNEVGFNIKNSKFLVAIFESVLNITAQTCGGTLVAPHWVLTAATCVDLLSHLYENKNFNILDSHYYIIANAINPLIDGTVHNVTEIVFPPKYYLKSEMSTVTPLELRPGIKIPSLVLLRIEPPVNGNIVGIVNERIKPGLKVDIYSWGLIKNSTTNRDSMTVTTFEAITLESNDCKANYSFIEDYYLICLSVFEATDLETHLTSSGGPVVVSVKNKFLMAAVVQHDSNSTFVGYLLYPHYSWILEVIAPDIRNDLMSFTTCSIVSLYKYVISMF